MIATLQQDIIEVLKQQPIEVRAQVTEVSVDMWAGFPKIITEVFPKAAVVIDRFHVMKLVLETLNKIRRLVGVKTKGSKYLQDLRNCHIRTLAKTRPRTLGEQGVLGVFRT